MNASPQFSAQAFLKVGFLIQFECFSAVNDLKAVAGYCFLFSEKPLHIQGKIDAVLYLAMHQALLVLKGRSEKLD